MAEYENDDGIAVLVGLGILAVAGVGILAVLKAIATYQPGETITVEEAAALAAPRTDSFGRKYAYCSRCGEETEQCRYKSISHCMECNGGSGYSKGGWCTNCFHEYLQADPVDNDNDD